MDDLERFKRMAAIKLSKLDRAEFILESTIMRVREMEEIIGPSGTVSSLLMNTQFNDQAVDIAVLVDELSTDIDDLHTELKKRIESEDD